MDAAKCGKCYGLNFVCLSLSLPVIVCLCRSTEQGAGTAIGELPPYFMARAARLSGADPNDQDYQEFEEMMEQGANAQVMSARTHAYTHTCMQARTDAHTHASTHTHTRMDTQECKHAYTHTHTHTRTHAHACTHTPCTHTPCTHTDTQSVALS